jgi:hypothetical protein
MGIGWTVEEEREFSARVDLPALRAYRAAVADETRSGLTAGDFDDLDKPVPGAGKRALAAGDLAPGQEWVADWMEERGKWWLLSYQVIGHSYMHLGEAHHAAGLLGLPGH